MSNDQQPPKDPAAAAEILANLKTKDMDESVCRYPFCHDPRQAPARSGRPSAYCQDPTHTALSNHRVRQQLKTIANGAQEAMTKQEPSPGIAGVESLRSGVVAAMIQLQSNLERYVTTLTEIADPDVSAAQIQASLDRADTRIAEAQQAISAEKSLRLAAEAASQTARRDAQAEREAAELAIQHMEAAEARMQSKIEEAEQHIAEVQAERDDTIDRIEAQAQEKIHQAHVALDIAQEEAKKAHEHASEVEREAQANIAVVQEEARQALSHAHTVEVESRAQVSAAKSEVERERAEVDRLRKELSDTVAEARTRAETERTEARHILERERMEVDRLRKELSASTTEARARANADRSEIDQLRKELAAVRAQVLQSMQRADQVAVQNDELRAQLTKKHKQ